MRLIIRDDENEACKYVANYVVERINAFQPTPEHPFILGLPTGSSPIGVYNELVRRFKAGEVCPTLSYIEPSSNRNRSLLRM